MKPIVEELESRCNPAPLLALSAAQLASLRDAAGFNGEPAAVTAGPVQVPAKAANSVISLGTELTGGAGGALAVIRGGDLVEVHFFGGGGAGADAGLYASAFAQAEGLPLYEPTHDPALDGQLPADANFIADLLELQSGDVITDVELTEALDVLPATLAPPGEPLRLAVAVEGGFRVHTLTLTSEYGEPAWAITESVFAETLGADVWQLSL